MSLNNFVWFLQADGAMRVRVPTKYSPSAVVKSNGERAASIERDVLFVGYCDSAIVIRHKSCRSVGQL